MLDLVAAWRDAAEAVAADHWRRSLSSARFEKNLSADKEASVATVRPAKWVGAARLQMGLDQVVGTRQSFVSKRQNDAQQVVDRSSLDGTTKHQRHTTAARRGRPA